MRIVAFEGLDKSGKFTQSKLLAEALARKGLRVVQSEFHRYDTPTGELIAKWLRKEYDVDQLTIELIMAADKQAQQKWFLELERDGVDVLILDRYTTSQWVYAQANGVDPDFCLALQSNMRQPDHVIYIDIPADVSMSRKGKHNNGENDRYESDYRMLEDVRSRYQEDLGGHDLMVNGLLTVEEIHQEILSFAEYELAHDPEHHRHLVKF